MASHATVAGAGVVPVLAGARGRAATRSSAVKVNAARGAVAARPVSLPASAGARLGNAEQRVRVRFAYAPGAVRASVRVYAENGTLDPAEVRRQQEWQRVRDRSEADALRQVLNDVRELKAEGVSADELAERMRPGDDAFVDPDDDRLQL